MPFTQDHLNKVVAIVKVARNNPALLRKSASVRLFSKEVNSLLTRKEASSVFENPSLVQSYMSVADWENFRSALLPLLVFHIHALETLRITVGEKKISFLALIDKAYYAMHREASAQRKPVRDSSRSVGAEKKTAPLPFPLPLQHMISALSAQRSVVMVSWQCVP